MPVLKHMKDRESYNARQRVYQLERYHRIRREILSHLGGVCNRCGSPDKLEIDHIDPSTKKLNISRVILHNQKALWEEVQKCQLLCRDCHNLKTIADCGRKVAIGTHGTISSYKYCKCSLCKEAWNSHNREYKKRWREKKGG